MIRLRWYVLTGRTVVAYLGVEEVEKVTKYQNRRFLGIQTSVHKLCYGLIDKKPNSYYVYLFLFI
jgi:hypothetical protein